MSEKRGRNTSFFPKNLILRKARKKIHLQFSIFSFKSYLEKSRWAISNWNWDMSQASRNPPLTWPYTKNEITTSRLNAKTNFFEKMKNRVFFDRRSPKSFFFRTKRVQSKDFFLEIDKRHFKVYVSMKNNRSKKIFFASGNGGGYP